MALAMPSIAKRGEVHIQPELLSAALSSRMNQILIPLLSITEDQGARLAMLGMASAIEERHGGEKRQLPEALVLEVLRDLLAAPSESKVILLSLITKTFEERHGAEFKREITNRYMGSLVSKKLHLFTYKTKGVVVMPRTEAAKVKNLCEKFGITDSDA